FGSQKINLHQAGAEFQPHAHRPTPGSADLCFIVEEPLDEVVAQLHGHNLEILVGPVARTGATGPIRSVYLLDPDLNLIELSNYVEMAEWASPPRPSPLSLPTCATSRCRPMYSLAPKTCSSTGWARRWPARVRTRFRCSSAMPRRWARPKAAPASWSAAAPARPISPPW